ncbi:MAG TPA: bifunctional diaminohydroxyphosphoribosylaminopyrimidine deaminase/5-amino-6-(5-phosphoribosylamino)uracil reductase RibD, partial [Phycisphaerales bacterium]|nr:bifunctional diaminohydroxyphosphoribosylaminopyrimidine deaminase/5-amino-6-(5-phosphoribosylamino)uracil reductase RibD [Phycisphaerales bacterium]
MNATDRDRLDRLMLKRAALVALRGEGHVEPNPMVGCVIGREMGAGVEVLGIGHHRRYGDKHAEVEALEDARRRAAGEVAEMLRGATAWVTLEPCCHFGKQPPCTDALIAAGIGRVVYARRDPNAISAGGAEKLRAAGIVAEERPLSRLALAVSEPFIKRVTTGLPWVIAKWAQTMDGRIATRTGES